jgi:hypothetical protein
MRRYAARLTVAALVAAAVGLGVPTPAAQASTCGSARGVTVVVDFHQLGGGVQTFCDIPGAGSKTADTQLRDAGHALTYVQRQPGFICRIDGKPASDPCVNTPPADAYWSLWWSNGTSGRWAYSSLGPSSLKVPAGGYVAMSWQAGSGKAPPGVSPKPHATKPSASPTPHPSSAPQSSGPGQAPASSPSASTVGPTGTSAPASQKSQGHSKKHPLHSSKAGRGPATASRSADQAQAGARNAHVVAAGSADSGGSGGLPGWVSPVVIAVLFLGAGTVALVRRKSSGG